MRVGRLRRHVRCWGLNSNGQLGNNTLKNATLPVAVTALSGATAVAVGADHTCALLFTGNVRCWGVNSFGQLGNPFATTAKVPVGVSGVTGGTGIIAIADAPTFRCQLVADGTVQCQGDNSQGQLGNGTVVDSGFPVTVLGLAGATAIVVGRHYTCALIVDGTVQCWGYNQFGELGDGNLGVNSSVPVVVKGLSGVVALAAGDHHTCARLVDGSVTCWGWNEYGELGNPTPGIQSTIVAVNGLTGVTALTAGDHTSCALLVNGTEECWGFNGFGELGDGSETVSSSPVPVFGLGGITAIAQRTDSGTSCALIVDGTVQCWGYNGFGEIGHGDTSDPSLTAGQVIGLTGATAVALGDFHTCALLADGTARCWGADNFGQLGDGNTTDSILPVVVNGVSGAAAISAGDRYGCVLLAAGSVHCWS